jgi:hypothetical protein
MVRRIELLLGALTAIAAVAAIVATIFVPVAKMGLEVGDRAPIIQPIYARDFGVARLVVVMALIALLGALVLLGAYSHARRGSTFGRALVLSAALSYVALTILGLEQSIFAEYPAMLSLACTLFAYLPARGHSGSTSASSADHLNAR